MATSTLGNGTLVLAGTTSGTTTVTATAVAGTTTLTLPAATDTLVGRATTDTLTNKTLTGAVMNGTVGATTPSTGAFTTLSATGNVTLGDASTDTLNVGNGDLIKDASGNLGVSVTPSAWSQGRAIEVLEKGYGFWNGTSSAYVVANAYFNGGFKYGGTGQASHYYQYQGAHVWSTAASGTAGNAITFTQAMTLDASGCLQVGTTSQLINESTLSLLSVGNTMTVKTTGGAATVPILCWNNAASGTINLINFFYGSSFTAGGTITTNGTVTTLNSPSDYRLKNITGVLTTSGAFIDALKPLVGTYKSNGSAFVGFVADQLQEVSPSSVQGEKDAVDEKGNPVYQSLAYASPEIITNLVAEIQSLRKRLAALESA